MDAGLSGRVSGCEEEVHVGPILPGQVEGQANKVPHEFGVVGQLMLFEGGAVHAAQCEGGREDGERGVGIMAADEMADGVVDLVE
jgi:hypothetical protein